MTEAPAFAEMAERFGAGDSPGADPLADLLREADAFLELTEDYATLHYDDRCDDPESRDSAGGNGKSRKWCCFPTWGLMKGYAGLHGPGDLHGVAGPGLGERAALLLGLLAGRRGVSRGVSRGINREGPGVSVMNSEIAADLEGLLRRAEGGLTVLVTCCSVEAHLPYGNVYVYRTRSEEADGRAERGPHDVSYVVDVDLNSRLLFLAHKVDQKLKERGL